MSAQDNIEQGNIYFWEDQGIVSMAGYSRPIKHGVTLAYVYTPPEQRGKGSATALLATLSQKALDDGMAFCTLYTNLANPTSKSIYQKVGYRPIGDVMDVDFNYQ